MQQNILYLTIFFSLLLLALFLFVVGRSSSTKPYTERNELFEKLRSLLFWLCMVVSVPAIALLTIDLPYSTPNHWTDHGRTIEAVASQWRWQLSDDNAYVGEQVNFRVSSADVTHSFALYDPQGHLVAQTQAMPGYTNILHYKFDQAGKFKVLCLEYCGLAHQGMVAELNVADRAEGRM